jgi:hypothetical protein
MYILINFMDPEIKIFNSFEICKIWSEELNINLEHD